MFHRYSQLTIVFGYRICILYVSLRWVLVSSTIFFFLVHFFFILISWFWVWYNFFLFYLFLVKGFIIVREQCQLFFIVFPPLFFKVTTVFASSPSWTRFFVHLFDQLYDHEALSALSFDMIHVIVLDFILIGLMTCKHSLLNK